MGLFWLTSQAWEWHQRFGIPRRVVLAHGPPRGFLKLVLSLCALHDHARRAQSTKNRSIRPRRIRPPRRGLLCPTRRGGPAHPLRDTGCDPGDPATWTKPVIRLGMYAQPPCVAAANTPVLHRAFNQLAGPGRWFPCQSMGTFPVRFPSVVGSLNRLMIKWVCVAEDGKRGM